MRHLLVTLALCMLLAGCSDAQPAASDSLGLPPPPPALWTDCRQWHLHFDARAADFQEEVPDGFTVQSDAVGLTTLLIHVTLCAERQEALVAVPVEAPAEHEDTERTELAIVQVFQSNVTLYPDLGGRVVEATFEEHDTPRGPHLIIDGGGEHTELQLDLRPSSGTFGAERWLRFAETADTAEAGGLAAIAFDGSESTNAGFGLVTYTHEGPGGAPPATVGIAHAVKDLDIIVDVEVRE